MNAKSGSRVAAAILTLLCLLMSASLGSQDSASNLPTFSVPGRVQIVTTRWIDADTHTWTQTPCVSPTWKE